MVRRWEDIPHKEHRVFSFRKLQGSEVSPVKAAWWLCAPGARASSGKRINGAECSFLEQDVCFSLQASGGFCHCKILIFWLFFYIKSNFFWQNSFNWCLGPFYSFLVADKVQVLSLPPIGVEIIVYRCFFVLSDLEAGNLRWPFHPKLTCMPVVMLANQEQLRAQTVESSGGWIPSSSMALADWPEIWA